MTMQMQQQPLDPALISRLLAVAPGPELAREVLAAAQRFDAVKEVFAYRLGTACERPSMLLSSSGIQGCDRRVGCWLSHFHALDPLRSDHGSADTGQAFSRRVSASDIGDPIYRAICFDDPQFIDKLSFAWHARAQSLVLNFYRGPGSGNEVGGPLATLASIVLAVLAGPGRACPIDSSQQPDVAWIETRMAHGFPQLSLREREVCARTLAGWSARAIAAALGIRAGTVLTYRQRAYARLGFSRAADFLSRLLN